MTQIPGLSERNNRIVGDILRKYAHMSPFVLFGSRAKGNYRAGSDIDIAVKGACGKDDVSRMMADFDDSLLPYFVDVVGYDRISNQDLKDHIDRVGMIISFND